MRKLFVVLVIILIALAIALAPPFISKRIHREQWQLAGPRLEDLHYVELSFRNGRLNLGGLLFLPQGEGPFPVAVFIQGSGESRRDNRWYLTVAKDLQENGIAVLIPDKRGSGKSGGDWRKATFNDLASDASSAVDFVDAQTVFRHEDIGLIGLSQGGWIAPIVATENKKVAFVASLSGAGVTTDEQLSYEVVNDIADYGTYRFVARLIGPIAAYFCRRSEFWHLITGFDPIPYWRRVHVPAFMAFGEGDKNVPVEESVRRIKALNQGIAVKVYPKGGHGIIDPATHRVQQQCLDDLTKFIHRAKLLRAMWAIW